MNIALVIRSYIFFFDLSNFRSGQFLSMVFGHFWGVLDVLGFFYHNSLSSTISFMLLMTFLVISLRLGLSCGVSSAVSMALQALLNLEVSLTGLGNTVGLRVAKFEMPVISTIKFRKSKDQRKIVKIFAL